MRTLFIISLLATLSWAPWDWRTAEAGPEPGHENTHPRNKEDYKGIPTGRMVYYSGQVQGVGFRATTARMAIAYPVTGWVKNLADGRVQLLVEGPADAVQEFLQALRSHWKDNIQKEQVEERPVSNQFKEFAIAY